MDTAIRRIAVCLFATDAILVAAYLLATFLAWPGIRAYQLLNLDAEASLAAWASSSQLMICAVLFGLIANREPLGIATRWTFFCVAFGFLFLSADEAAAIHEKLTVIAQSAGFEISAFDGHGAWIPLYIGLGLGFLLATRSVWRSIWYEQRRSALLLILGCGIFFSGAVVMEIASYGVLRDAGMESLYGLQVAVEEAFELCGVSTLLIGSIRLLSDRHL